MDVARSVDVGVGGDCVVDGVVVVFLRGECGCHDVLCCGEGR